MERKAEEDMDVCEGDTIRVLHDEQSKSKDTDMGGISESENTSARKEDAASSGYSQPALGQSLSLKHNQPKQQPSSVETWKETILYIEEEESTPFSASSMSQCVNQDADQESQIEKNNDTSLLNRVKDMFRNIFHHFWMLLNFVTTFWRYKEGKKELCLPIQLEQFGYYFNEAGELRSIEGDEPFKFMVRENDHGYNQRRYEALGEVITEYVYSLLTEKAGLVKITIPLDAADDEARGFFFMSPGAMKKETILLIIHGNGAVRAGQWTRKLIINNGLDKGTQLPYIEFGKKQGYGVVVLNTNQNVDDNGGIIRGSESPVDHALYVWDNFIKCSAVKHVAVVAHSYGGVVTSALSDERETFRERVFAVAFTDSVHAFRLSEKTRQLFAECAVNWVKSDRPLDTKLGDFGDAKRCSAGHPVHEWTSHSARESVFKFIVEKHQKFNKTEYCVWM